MRTPQQIEAIRAVLTGQIGLAAKFLSPEEIDAYANTLQDSVAPITRQWEIRVKFFGDGNKKWEDIQPEPKKPFAMGHEITAKCLDLLHKYSKIFAIKAQVVDSPLTCVVFQR